MLDTLREGTTLTYTLPISQMLAFYLRILTTTTSYLMLRLPRETQNVTTNAI